MQLLFFLTLTLLLSLAPSIAEAGRQTNPYNEVFDFAAVPCGKELRHSFTVPNTTGKVLKVARAYSSDRSVQILSYPASIPPDASGMIEARWIPAPGSGVEGEITLDTNAADSSARRYLLEGQAQAGSSEDEGCHESATGIPAEIITRIVKKRDASLYIAAEEAIKESRRSSRILFVDVRGAEAYDGCRIPGSVNLPLHALKTKPFLASRTVVLVDEGYSGEQLERACRQMQDRGVVAWILKGGLNYWKNRFGRLQGSAVSQARIGKIAPGDFFRERVYEDWIVLSDCRSQSCLARYVLPESIQLGATSNSAAFSAQLTALLGKLKANPQSFILFFNDEGKDYERIEGLFTKAGVKNTYFLDGGLTAYNSFLERQASILQPGTNTRRVQKKCASCP